MEKNLLHTVGEQLNIICESSETERDWLLRIVYSWAGLIGLSSLWDVDKDNREPFVSIKHVKARMNSVIDAASLLNENIAMFFSVYGGKFVDSIFELYLNNGYMYHMENNVKRVKPVVSDYGDIMLLRGLFPANCEVSGLGLLGEKFHLSEEVQSLPLVDFGKFRNEDRQLFLDELEKSVRWEPIQFTSDMMFFNMALERGQKYWGTTPQEFNPFSLLKKEKTGLKTYALYRNSGKEWECAWLPYWRTSQPKKEYLRIINALMLYSAKKIIHLYRREGSTDIVKLGCLLPPEEEHFFLLYSWPVTFFEGKDFVFKPFERRMDSRVFDIFKDYLMELGYLFKEE